jgi:uncharacterized membrane protein YcaP (DUF421 family)
MLLATEWQKMFAFDTPPIEIIVRGSVMYLGLFFLLRIILKRESGGLGTTDLLVVVLLADASQNAMAGNYTSISDGILLVLVIIMWSYILNLLAYWSPWVEKLLRPGKLLLIKNGKMLRRNMKEELVTVRELLAEMRKNGVSDINDVDSAYMENDGTISFICPKIENSKPKDKKDLF